MHQFIIIGYLHKMEQVVAPSAPSAIELPETESRLSNSFLRLRKHLMRKVGEAIVDYGMIEEGESVEDVARREA